MRYDVCDEHGVWFDAGELSAVLRYAGVTKAGAETPDEPFAEVLTRLERRWPFRGR